MLLSGVVSLIGLVTLATATPVAPAAPRAQPGALHRVQPIQARQDNNDPPCAQASAAYYGQNGTSFTSINLNVNIPAEMAYQCLTSAPFNATLAKDLVKTLPTWLDFQSTLQALKSPPPQYAALVQPPVDILGGLDQIASDIDAGKFTNEYEFGWALYLLLQSAHDGHLVFVPDSVGAIFAWGRPVPLVSVSADGAKLPAVFTFDDVLGMQYKNISYTPSAVTKIDGMDVKEFLEDYSQYGSLQDRDALYNNLFYSLPQITQLGSGAGTGVFTGGGRGQYVYPGATTTLTFANGTNYTMENYARVRTSLKDMRTGEDLAKQFFHGMGTSTPRSDSVADSPPLTKPLGYPEPIVAGPANTVNGFYLDDSTYGDVAVLQAPSFVSSYGTPTGFQAATREFLNKAKADGKKKLIIDLQANGGGTIMLGYDLFKQLFPNLDPYGASRLRASKSLDFLGQDLDAFAAQEERNYWHVNSTVANVQASYFDHRMDMTVDGKPFSSWDDKFGPNWVINDYYTNLERWNLTDYYMTIVSGGINITGYGDLANYSASVPLFEPENIVLLTDGYCASTCTIFSELMTSQAGVKTIALGGRSTDAQIQAIGGVKGTNNWAFTTIAQYAKIALQKATGDLKATLNTTNIPELTNYNSIVYRRSTGIAGVNLRDGLPLNDTGVALQFIYKEADCRLYYTPEMMVDATTQWKAAADAQWGNTGKCVAGDGYGKRMAHQATTSLSPSNVRANSLSHSEAEAHIAAFRDTFSIETEWDGSDIKEGFMTPW